MPESLFTEASVVHEFEDGWTIFDLSGKEDLDKLGKGCVNCWTSDYWQHKLLPAPGAEDMEAVKAQARERAVKRWDRPEYRKAYGDEWVEVRIENDTKTALSDSKRVYKLMALVDNDGNLRAGWALGLRDAPNITYGSCDDLGQRRLSWIERDGFEFCLLQAQPARKAGSYSYNVTGESLEHLVEWWQGSCAGEWQESSVVKKLRSYAVA